MRGERKNERKEKEKEGKGRKEEGLPSRSAVHQMTLKFWLH